MKNQIIILSLVLIFFIVPTSLSAANNEITDAAQVEKVYKRLKHFKELVTDSYKNNGVDWSLKKARLSTIDNTNYTVELVDKSTDVIEVKSRTLPAAELLRVLGISFYYKLALAAGTAASSNNQLLMEMLNEIKPRIALEKTEKKWIINDQDLVIEIARQLELSQKLYVNGEKAPLDYNQRVKNLPIVILVDERSVDKNFDGITFFDYTELALPENIQQPIYDKILFEELQPIFQRTPELVSYFNLIEDKSSWTDISSDIIPFRIEKTNMVKLHAFEPEIRLYRMMLNNLKPKEGENPTTKELELNDISIFGKWGYDNIPIMGWFMDEIIVGLRYARKQATFEDYRRTSVVSLGMTIPLERVFKKAAPTEKFLNSGNSVFAGLKTVLPFWEKYIEINLEAKLAINNKKTVNYDETTAFDFYSLRNFGSFDVKYYTPIKDIEPFPGFNLGNLEVSIGYLYAVFNYFRFDPLEKEVEVNDKKFPSYKPDHFMNLKVGLAKYDGFTSYRLDIFFLTDLYYLGGEVKNITDLNGISRGVNQAYVGANFEILFNDWFGFSTAFASYMPGLEKLNGWAKDFYIVFSPIIKFNF